MKCQNNREARKEQKLRFSPLSKLFKQNETKDTKRKGSSLHLIFSHDGKLVSGGTVLSSRLHWLCKLPALHPPPAGCTGAIASRVIRQRTISKCCSNMEMEVT